MGQIRFQPTILCFEHDVSLRTMVLQVAVTVKVDFWGERDAEIREHTF